jgi:hypothetical protein
VYVHWCRKIRLLPDYKSERKNSKNKKPPLSSPVKASEGKKWGTKGEAMKRSLRKPRPKPYIP